MLNSYDPSQETCQIMCPYDKVVINTRIESLPWNVTMIV
jgi:hypothetical protein